MILQVEVVDLIVKILGAIKVIGECAAKLIASLFEALGVSVPYQAIQILMIVLMIFAVLKIGSTISKIILVVVVIILIVPFFIPSSF